MTSDPQHPPTASDSVRVSAAKCVRCGQPVMARTRPFCSQRCADLDLGGWLTERYRVATDEAPQEGAPAGADPDAEG